MLRDLVQSHKPSVYFLLKSHKCLIMGKTHYVRAWRVEKVMKIRGQTTYEFVTFTLSHSEAGGLLYQTEDFQSIEALSFRMSWLISNLQLTFS